MLHDPSLSERDWSRIKVSVITAAAVGVVRVACGVARDVITESIRRSLGWEDDPDDDDDDDTEEPA